MVDSDSAWIRAAKAGDTGAFDRLVRSCESAVLASIVGILGRCPAVYDVYQDSLVAAFTKIGGFRADSSFSTWLTRIAINRALNERRREKNARLEPIDRAQYLSSDDEDGPDAMRRAEIREQTEQAMELLSDRERAVFVLKHHHGYKLREIATMLGCAEGTVKNYLFRGTRKLRDALEPVYRNT